MIALMFYVLTLSTPVSARRCQEHGPRLDGTYVTVCAGSVVRVRDTLGNVREWHGGGETVVLRSPGAAPMLLGRDGR